jgi:hypothetical protein
LAAALLLGGTLLVGASSADDEGKIDLLGGPGAEALREYIQERCNGNERKAAVVELWRHSNGEISGRFENRSRHVIEKKIAGRKVRVTLYSNTTTLHFHGDPNEERQGRSGKQIFLSNGNYVFANDLARVVDRAEQ